MSLYSGDTSSSAKLFDVKNSAGVEVHGVQSDVGNWEG